MIWCALNCVVNQSLTLASAVGKEIFAMLIQNVNNLRSDTIILITLDNKTNPNQSIKLLLEVRRLLIAELLGIMGTKSWRRQVFDMIR